MLALQRFELDEPQYGEYVRFDLIGYEEEGERIEEEKEEGEKKTNEMKIEGNKNSRLMICGIQHCAMLRSLDVL